MVVVNAIIAIGVRINFVTMAVGVVISLVLGWMSWRFNKLTAVKLLTQK